jgi:hypothetical protein
MSQTCVESSSTSCQGQSVAEFVAQQAFKALIFFGICSLGASLSSTQRKKKRAFAYYILFGMVVVQYYHIFRAQNVTYPIDGSAEVVRKSCLESSKGGKRAVGDERPNTLNPCWCHSGAVCVGAQGDECPADGDTSCYEPDVPGISPRRRIAARMSVKRDCARGQRATCSASQPCTPCETSKAASFGLVGIGNGTWERCISCSPENRWINVNYCNIVSVMISSFISGGTAALWRAWAPIASKHQEAAELFRANCAARNPTQFL